jgi:MFS family permease
LSVLGKFGAAASFTIVFVYTAEMFPTEIRSTAVGSSSTCARVGGILAPQVKKNTLQNERGWQFFNKLVRIMVLRPSPDAKEAAVRGL